MNLQKTIYQLKVTTLLFTSEQKEEITCITKGIKKLVFESFAAEQEEQQEQKPIYIYTSL